MKLLLDRKYKKPEYTIGNLYADGKWICNTIEDVDRGLTNEMSYEEIKAKKIPGQTAIPTGKYEITYTYSPKFKCLMPLVNSVRGFSAIRIHWGNTAADSAGCIIVGMNKAKGKVIESKATYMKLNDIMRAAYQSGQKIIIEIK